MNEIIIKIFRRSFVAWAGLGFLLLIVSLSGGRGASLRVHLQVELSFPGLSLLHLLLMV